MSVSRGICAAVVTPLSAQHEPDAATAFGYYTQLLEEGCDALNILGTTGEAMSLSVAQRSAFTEALVARGLPAARAMVGTGASALQDAVALTRGALDAGFGGALVMPPFFYRIAGEEGTLRFFDALFEAVDPPPRSVYLYHFPQMSGMPFGLPLVERLVQRYPGIVAGLKDSANDLEYETALARRFPELDVFPSSESHVLFARTHGLGGCISGTVALWSARAQRLWSQPEPDEALQAELHALRSGVAAENLIAAVRARLASDRADDMWRRTAPPL